MPIITTPFFFPPLRTALSENCRYCSSFSFLFFCSHEITPEEIRRRVPPPIFSRWSLTTIDNAGFYFRYNQGGDVDAYDINVGGDDVPWWRTTATAPDALLMVGRPATLRCWGLRRAWRARATDRPTSSVHRLYIATRARPPPRERILEAAPDGLANAQAS